MKFKLLFIPPLLSLLFVTIANSASPHNIFDDDWTPPKARENATPIIVIPTTAPAPRPAVDAKPRTPNDQNAVVHTTTTVRRAIPSKSEQVESRRVLREVYGEQLRDHSSSARQKVIGVLLTQTENSTTSSVDQFVLSAAAEETAVDAADLPSALRAADIMAKNFDVDGLAIKVDATNKVMLKSSGGDVGPENVHAALELVDQLLAAEDFVAAGRISSVLLSKTAANPALRGEVQQCQHKVNFARDMRISIAKDIERLKVWPTDPAAHLAVGRFFCFVKHDWVQGLPQLAAGSDMLLNSIAKEELAASRGSMLLPAADSWWEAAAKQTDPLVRLAITGHAAELYQQAIGGSSGMRRAKIEKRIEESAQLIKKSSMDMRSVNLLRLLDLNNHDQIIGTWTMRNGVLECTAEGVSRIEFAITPPEEYDYRIMFTRTVGNEAVEPICFAGDHQFGVTFGGWGNTVVGLQLFNGRLADGNRTTKRRGKWLVNGQRTAIVVKVRKTGVEAWLDGNLIFECKTDYKNVGSPVLEQLSHTNTIGIMVFHSSVKIESAEIIAVTGEGKLVR